MINLYFVDIFDLKENGLSTYMHELLQQLSYENDIQVHFVWVKSQSRYPNFTKEISGTGVVNYYIPGNIGLQNHVPNYDVEVVKYLYSEIAGSKNIIFHFNWINHAVLARLLKQQIPDCKTVLIKHCIPWRDFITKDYNTFVNLNKELEKRKVSCHIYPALVREKISYEAMDHIICVTEFAKNAMQKMLHISSDKLSVIYNGLNSSITKSNKGKLRKKYGFREDENIILFAGKLQQSKGVNDLVTAFNLLFKKISKKDESQLRLVIAGTGNYSELLQEINTCYSKITITGSLDKKTLYDFYQMADIGVVTSYVEQCSYTAIEMMQFGLPIIVSNVDGLKEIVPDNCGLKVRLVLGKNKAYIDANHLAEKIQFYLDNPEVAKQYAAKARRHAKKNFTAQRMADETIAVYEKLIAEKDEQTQVLTNNNSPLVSVLLPVYNGEKYLQECINSILKQTYPKFELLIVDDGSTDITAAIVQQYKDGRIVYIKNEKNEGIVNSLNKGIKIAKGKYIARIDADDMMHPERLQKQIFFLEDKKNKDVAVVGSHHYVTDSSGKMVGLKQYPVSDAEIKGSLFFQNPFSHPSVMFRTYILKKYKYTKKYEHAEDYSLWFRIASEHKMANISDFLTYYRVHETNTSKYSSNNQKENTAELLSTELDKLSTNHTPQELTISIAMVFGFGRRYFNTHEKVEAAKKWINKVLTSEKNRSVYTLRHLKKMEEYIIESCCGIYL